MSLCYAPHFYLRAFDSLPEPARVDALVHLLEALVLVNCSWLRGHPRTPTLYTSGVRYMEEPPGRDDWQDIPETLARGDGDCEDLACWRLAELRVRTFEDARPFVRCTVSTPKHVVYHVQVRRSDGRIEDPSRVLGMR